MNLAAARAAASATSLRVLRFPPDFAEARIVAQENLLWPCLAFHIRVVFAPPPQLNLFEQAVLRLAVAGLRDVKTIADRCLLSPDLVAFILEKLRRLGALTMDLKPASEPWERRSQPEDAQETHGVAFVDLIGGRLLPFLLKGTPVAHTARKEGERWRLEDAEQMSWRALPPNPALEKNVPSQEEVERLLLSLSASHRARPLQAAPLLTAPPRSERGIFMEEIPERLNLAMACVIQEEQVELMLTDPFGAGFSLTMTRVYEGFARRDPEERRKVEELIELAHLRDRRPAGMVRSAESGACAKTRALLEEAARLESRALGNGGAEIEKDARIALAECWRKLFSALEWALLHVVRERPPSPAIEGILVRQGQENNARILEEIACRCGFEIPRAASPLRAVDGGAVASAREQAQPRFAPLLALALAGIDASERHPLRDLAAADPQWLIWTSRLKLLRDKDGHGELLDGAQESHSLAQYGRDTRRAVAHLLPEMEPLAEEDAGTTPGDVANARRRARSAVVRRLGYPAFAETPPDLRERLIALEAADCASLGAADSDQAVDASEFVLRMAGLTQALLRRIPAPTQFSDSDATGATGADVKTEAFARARSAGFSCPPEGPPSLRSVARGRLDSALAGVSSSLGADFLVFLLKADPAVVRSLAQRSPEALLFIDRLCALRGHGNGSVPLLPTEIEEISGRFYDLFKSFTEI